MSDAGEQGQAGHERPPSPADDPYQEHDEVAEEQKGRAETEKGEDPVPFGTDAGGEVGHDQRGAETDGQQYEQDVEQHAPYMDGAALVDIVVFVSCAGTIGAHGGLYG